MRAKNSIGLIVLAIAATLVSCHKQPHHVRPIVPEVSVPATGHGQENPPSPVECPLAKQGIRADHLRPFEDTEKYIAFLERPDRATWQRPEAVVEALALTGDETVADIGAGSGYFSFRFAHALPRGAVHAVDIDPEMVRHIHHKAMTEGIKNLHVTLGKPDDPGVSRDTNLVFVCDVLHHVSDRAAWLGKLASEMRTEARLALIEFKEGPLPQGPPESAKIPRATLISLVTHTGLVLERDQPDLLPYQTFLVFRKP